MSRRVGLDPWAIGIHIFVTITLAVAFGEASSPDDDIVIPLVFAGSAILFEWRRRRALAQRPQEGLTTGEVHLERMEELEQRVAEVEILHARVAELEERLDFSERLLVQAQAPRELAEGGTHRLDGGPR